MITLTPEEHRIVSVARALVGRPTSPVITILKRAHSAPYLTADARYLIEEAIAVGWVEVLARSGGWRERIGPGGRGGRLWDRHDAVEMSFSRFAPRLCEYLATAPLWFGERERLTATPETPGDHLMCLLAARLMLDSGCDRAVADVGASWLVQLVYPDVVVVHDAALEPAAVSLDDPCALVLVDGLGDWIARRIVEVEAARARVVDLDVAVRLGALQASILESLLSGLEAAGAPELGRFALDAGAAILESPPAYGDRLGPGSIAERAEARRACASFLRSLARWRQWAEAARAVRFFEDDYDRSQRVLSLWETLGDRGHARLAAIADELAALS